MSNFKWRTEDMWQIKCCLFILANEASFISVLNDGFGDKHIFIQWITVIY